MKIRKIIMGLSLLLTTGYVYAERMAQCKKYWHSARNIGMKLLYK